MRVCEVRDGMNDVQIEKKDCSVSGVVRRVDTMALPLAWPGLVSWLAS